ncbi:LysR family transcriptional regulator [Amycolatopsis minnesotensis]|uniref:LysR family transcriptional regulator n=1 Tax=Amycolatopsis minnesotensis TaxID=337894 RepID=A0ABP5BPT3_9PSEU
MELRQLRYFVAVAEEKNFRRAAERLHIAQPALSQQISKFENELHTELFRRTTRRVELTDSGRVLLAEGRRVLAEAEHALSAVTQAAHGEVGLLRVGFVSSAALGIVPAIVLALQGSWPGLHCELTESTTDPQLEGIAEGRLDVGIVREVDATPGLVIRPLLRERLIVAMHESHPLAHRRSVRLAELAGERFLVFPRHRVSRLYDHIAGLCHRAGFRLEPAQEAVQFPTLLGLAAANTGITIVPESLRALRLPGLRYVPITDQDAISVVSVVCRPDRENTPQLTKFLDTAASVPLDPALIRLPS